VSEHTDVVRVSAESEHTEVVRVSTDEANGGVPGIGAV